MTIYVTKLIDIMHKHMSNSDALIRLCLIQTIKNVLAKFYEELSITYFFVKRLHEEVAQQYFFLYI